MFSIQRVIAGVTFAISVLVAILSMMFPGFITKFTHHIAEQHHNVDGYEEYDSTEAEYRRHDREEYTLDDDKDFAYDDFDNDYDFDLSR
ncbi:MAG: hypothetical protein AAF549_02560 [Pseudomonadota bacterium]